MWFDGRVTAHTYVLDGSGCPVEVHDSECYLRILLYATGIRLLCVRNNPDSAVFPEKPEWRNTGEILLYRRKETKEWAIEEGVYIHIERVLDDLHARHYVLRLIAVLSHTQPKLRKLVDFERRADYRRCCKIISVGQVSVRSGETMETERTVRADELNELLGLYRMLNPDDPRLERTEELHEQWQGMVRDDSLEIVVVEDEGRLVSSCVLSITENLTRNARPFGVIENVITHEEHRKQGFGERCLEKAIEIAESRDCYKIMLLTGSNQEWKHEFYEGCGFDKREKTGFVFDLRE